MEKWASLLCSPASIDNLVNRIARVTDAMRVPGNLVVNLAPLPRYQNICFVETSHRLWVKIALGPSIPCSEMSVS